MITTYTTWSESQEVVSVCHNNTLFLFIMGTVLYEYHNSVMTVFMFLYLFTQR